MTGVLPRDVPVSFVLSAAACELDLAAFELGRVEGAIVAVLGQRPERTDSETLRAIQAIDMLNQTLSTLAAFLDLSARDVSGNARIDPSMALAPVRMKAMADRLVTRMSGEPVAEAAMARHEVELFGDTGS